MKKYLLPTVLIIIISFLMIPKGYKIVSQQKHSIIGNWYFIDSIDIDRKDYNEIYFNGKTLYQYLEVAGFIAPDKYKIVDDSLFLKGEEEYHFWVNINLISTDEFSMRIENQVRSFYRVKNGIVIEEVINKKKSRTDYSKDYFKRMVKVKKKLNIKQYIPE